MKPICCDSSFLFALYSNDVNTPRAQSYLRDSGQPLSLSVLNEFDLHNALRVAVWRKLFPAERVATWLTAFENDVKFERVIILRCNLTAATSHAQRISRTYTESGGHRAFEILHVAVALEIDAETFLSFNANQRTIAVAEGLQVKP